MRTSDDVVHALDPIGLLQGAEAVARHVQTCIGLQREEGEGGSKTSIKIFPVDTGPLAYHSAAWRGANDLAVPC